MSDAVVEETQTRGRTGRESRLLSDVPIGSFLSGGLDSSIVATMAARELATLDTFSVGFEDVEDPYHGRADEIRGGRADRPIISVRGITRCASPRSRFVPNSTRFADTVTSRLPCLQGSAYSPLPRLRATRGLRCCYRAMARTRPSVATPGTLILTANGAKTQRRLRRHRVVSELRRSARRSACRSIRCHAPASGLGVALLRARKREGGAFLGDFGEGLAVIAAPIPRLPTRQAWLPIGFRRHKTASSIFQMRCSAKSIG